MKNYHQHFGMNLTDEQESAIAKLDDEMAKAGAPGLAWHFARLLIRPSMSDLERLFEVGR